MKDTKLVQAIEAAVNSVSKHGAITAKQVAAVVIKNNPELMEELKTSTAEQWVYVMTDEWLKKKYGGGEFKGVLQDRYPVRRSKGKNQ